LAFSPDVGTVAVAGDYGRLRLRDTASQQPLGNILSTSGEGISSLAFTPDGAALYVTSPHPPVRRHPVNPSGAAGLICTCTGTTLSPAQWRLHSRRPYRNVCPGNG
jgi:hypothetical protein